MTLDLDVQRRDFIKTGFAGVLGAAVPMLLTSGEAYARNSGRWRTSFRNIHTGESYSGVYRVGDKYLPEAFQKISYILRDRRTGEVFPMDPHVIDIMSMIQRKTGRSTPMTILSGYRSPRTNNNLSRVKSGVAKNSFHMYGRALDMQMQGYRTSGLRQVARSLRAGGVGYYPRSNFVHVDTGDVRAW